MSLASLPRAGLPAALLSAVLAAGCSDSAKPPPNSPPASTPRQVGATVEDTAGARIANAIVYASRVDDIAFDAKTTDAAGVAHFTLADGRWCLYAPITTTGVPTRVAGSIGQVAHRTPPAVDSVLFRLVVRPPSVARGKVTLSGRAAHDGTFVGAAEFPFVTTTAADGSYALDGLPPGTWSGLATHDGFQPKLYDIPVPFPGDTITAGMTFTLQPGGPRPRPRPRP